MTTQVQKPKRAVVSQVQVCGYSVNAVLYGVWKRNTNKSCIVFCIRLTASVNEKSLDDEQSLKLRWMKSEILSPTVHTNEPDTLPNV